MGKLKIDLPPTPNRAKYPFVGSVKYRGLDIDLENLSGSTRSGADASGKPWKTKFDGAHYGELRGSRGADGDPLDVYIKDEPVENDLVFIVHQNHPGNHPTKAGKWDEDKVVLGVSSVDEARDLYLRHYNRRDFLRSITVMDFSKFKRYAFERKPKEKVAMENFYKLGMRLAFATAGVKLSEPGGTPQMGNAKPATQERPKAPEGDDKTPEEPMKRRFPNPGGGWKWLRDSEEQKQ